MNGRKILGHAMYWGPLAASYAVWLWWFGWKTIAFTVATVLLGVWFMIAERLRKDDTE